MQKYILVLTNNCDIVVQRLEILLLSRSYRRNTVIYLRPLNFWIGKVARGIKQERNELMMIFDCKLLAEIKQSGRKITTEILNSNTVAISVYRWIFLLRRRLSGIKMVESKEDIRLQPPRGLHLWLGSWCRHRHTHYYATRAFGSFVWHYHCMADNAKTGIWTPF